MKIPHPKYIIKQSDTLQSITQQFGYKENVWKGYHNTMCCLDDIIRGHLPPHLEKVYLLPELWEKEELLNSVTVLAHKNKVNKRISFGYEHTLPLIHFPKTLHYGVLITLSNKDQMDTIKYEVSVRKIAKEEKEHIIEVNRTSNTYINDMELDLMAEELAVKTASALYPLELIVSRADGIVGINNFKEIQKRWIDTKKRIREYYEGETLEKYLLLNDEIIMDSNSDLLLRSIKNDWFLHGYFNDIYQTYGTLFSFTNQIKVPFVIDTEGVEFSVRQSISDTTDDDGTIIISMEGTCTDERSINDLMNKSPFSHLEGEKERGKYWGKYFLESQHHTIIALNIEAELEKTKKKVSLTVSEIKKTQK